MSVHPFRGYRGVNRRQIELEGGWSAVTVRILTDSTCDLPEATVATEGISVVLLYTNVGDRGYLDGVELSRKEFYNRLPTFPEHPTTAEPGIEAFLEAYDGLAREGASVVVSIHISGSLSNVIDVARLAAERTSSVPVTAIDSGQLTLGVGLAAQQAARSARKGASVDEIVAQVEDQVSRTYTYAALSTVEFLRRSGRLTQFQSGLATLLRIVPLLKMHAGVAEMERIRTYSRAVQRLIDLATGLGPLEKLAIVHTNALDRATALYQLARHLQPDGTEPLYGQVTPVIGAHIGPGAVGFVCIARS